MYRVAVQVNEILGFHDIYEDLGLFMAPLTSTTNYRRFIRLRFFHFPAFTR